MDENKVENVQIVDEILKKIKSSIRKHENGVVVGWKSKTRLIITGCIVSALTNDPEFFNAYLPGGFFVCGTYNEDESTVINHPDFIVHIWLGLDDSVRCFLEDEKAVEMKVITGEQAVDSFAVNSILFRIRGLVNVKLTVEKKRYRFDPEDIVSADTIFKLVDEDMLLTFQSDQDILLRETKEPIKNSKDFFGPKKFARVFKSSNVNMLSCISSGRATVPYIKHDPYNTGSRSIPCFINALCLVNLSTPLTRLPQLFRTAATRQLYLLKKVIINHHPVALSTIPLPRFHHFFVPGWCHPISICFPANRDDKELESYRMAYLHRNFLLTADRPVFRRVQEEYQYPAVESDDALISPHLRVKDPSKKNGKSTVLDGAYSYYHYNQHKFNDNGWGCAYRSLQTLISWLRFQGYTEKPIPDHATIQKLTVEAGDRPKTFVGSKAWIGSVEVGHVLTAYTGVETKTLHVSRGSELNSIGRQLQKHFETDGTPIMIGGGVFAHTLLGVCFNDKTGDTLLLVLDPHYVGPENAEKVTSRGWCGWKNQNFWNQNAFYNLCIPQRPKGV